MERIDKIIASGALFRSDEISGEDKRVAVDGEAVTSSSRKADPPEASVITIDGKPLIFKKKKKAGLPHAA